MATVYRFPVRSPEVDGAPRRPVVPGVRALGSRGAGARADRPGVSVTRASSGARPAGSGAGGGRPGAGCRAASPRPAGPSRPAPPPLRLTRRGRIVVRVLLALLLLAVASVVVLLTGGRAAAGVSVRPVPATHRVVLPGETLLQLAAEVDPRADPRDVAVDIARLNGLDDWGLQAGQRLALPAGD